MTALQTPGSTTSAPSSASAAKKRGSQSKLGLMSRDLLIHAWLPIIVFAIVWIVSEFIENFYFPPVSRVLEQTWQVWVVEGGMVSEFVPSLIRLLVGFALAVLFGIILGTIMGLVRPAETALRPITEALRAIPGAALLPIAMMFFATGEAMKLSMIAFISMWPIMLNTIEGVRSVDPTLRSLLDSYRITFWDRFRFAYLPQAAPQIFAGARISLAVSVSVMVIVEMFGTPGGIGYFIRHAQQTFRIEDMWTGLLILGIFGYVINLLFRFIEKRVLKWHFSMVAHAEGNN